MKPTSRTTAQGELFGAKVQLGEGTSSRKIERFAAMAKAVDELFQASLQSEGPRAFDRYLDAVCRLRHLSAFNAMLVHAQRPGVTWVANKRQWERSGRSVLPGAIPILILQPFGPVSFLYEATDTDGPPLDFERNSTLLADGDASETEWRELDERAAEQSVRVVLTPFGTRLAGTARGMKHLPRRDRDRSFNWLVRLNSRFDLPTRIATLAHELGHIYCGHCGADSKSRWPDRSDLPYPVRELEAEAVAWLVSQRMGIRTRSREYLSRLSTREAIESIGKGLGMYAIIRAVEYIEIRRGLQAHFPFG